ncbi:AIPR family protein, partial [Arthrobacter sp. HMWF013]|uniref:AIPR family protein n=1 Tax=Arthrobacter sp. HMWF013 TaxID=2056849 RepID=UPI000D34B7AD
MSIEVDDLRNEIKVEAVAGDGAFELEAFAAVFARRLEDAEAAANLNVEPLRCNGPRRKRLELLGYGESPLEQSLVILAGRYFGRDATLTMTDAKDSIGRATGYIEAAVDGWLTTHLEMSSREWEYADYFSKQIRGGKIARIRVILITDGLMSGRIRTVESGTVAGLKATYEIWDQRRIVDATLPERGSEDIRVDFTKWLSDGLPCLVAPSNDETTRTYLAVIPARVLAEVFDEYGSLLLESNVRTFLSARGQVNRGIQSTLAQEPARFLAYNNGLTTTATEVELGRSSECTTIRSLHRWQIVNGGQTTASIAHFLRNNKSEDIIDEVSIQMKLVTVSESDSATVVQAVAKYANSQNRVSAADLFSTHEFHIRMEQISRRLKAPAKEGHQYQTGWFYERARGQWENDRTARGSAGEQAKFELEYPKSQRITKTDWAKYDYCWNQHPDLVSKGAQSVF